MYTRAKKIGRKVMAGGENLLWFVYQNLWQM